MTLSDVIYKLGQIKQNNLDLINSQIPPVKGDLKAGKDTKQPGGIPNRPYEAPKEDPKNPYVPAPTRLAGFPDEAGGNVTERGYFVDPNGDAYINTPNGMVNDGEYNVDIHGIMIPLAQQMMINKQTANLRPQDFTPFDMDGVRDMDGFLLPHIRTPAIREQEMKHFKRFIKNTGTSTWDLSQGNSPMMIASKKDDEINRQLILNSGGADPEDYLTKPQLKRYNEGKDFGDFIDIDMDLVKGNSPMLIAKGKKKKKKGLTIYEEAARRDALRDMGNEPYDPDTGRLGGGFDIMNDLLDGV